MHNILSCAVGVGGATVVGAMLGFVFRRSLIKYSPYILSLAAGIMLAAALTGLIEPALSGDTLHSTLSAVTGILLGVVSLALTDRFVPLNSDGKDARGAILFAIAIAIHNLPEGIAAGVAFGAGDDNGAFGVVLGIALHNLPEGMIAVTPLIASGVRPLRAFFLATAGAAAEIVGTVFGYLAIRISEAILPFALAFAGGTMLAVIAGEMIPESHTGGVWRATLTLVIGFTAMMVLGSCLS